MHVGLCIHLRIVCIETFNIASCRKPLKGAEQTAVGLLHLINNCSAAAAAAFIRLRMRLPVYRRLDPVVIDCLS